MKITVYTTLGKHTKEIRLPKCLFLTLLDIRDGVHFGDIFIPIEAIQQIKFDKGVKK